MQFDESKPTWVLQDSRAYGPFAVHMVGRDHVVLEVPNDKRLWSSISHPRAAEKTWSMRERYGVGRAPTVYEIFPISLITQDEKEALAWQERNEPQVGDLVTILYKVWDVDARNRQSKTAIGIVGRCTAHQLQIFAIDASKSSCDFGPCRGYHGLSRHVSKDSCIVISRAAMSPKEVKELKASLPKKVRSKKSREDDALDLVDFEV